MANRTYSNLTYTSNRGCVCIEGGFATNAASNPVTFVGPYGLAAAGPQSQSNLPNGISAIVHSGTGQYTLTFVDQFFTYLYAGCDLAMGTAANNYAQFNGFTNLNSASSALTCIITTFVGASAGDVAAATGNVVSFYFEFKNSTAV